MDNYYDALGVSRDADADQIHAAYRAAAKRYHPDRDRRHAEGSRFRAVQEAYETLGDPERRRAYDESRGERVPVEVRVHSGDRFTGVDLSRPPVWPTGEEPEPNGFEVELRRLMSLRMRRFEEILRRLMSS